MAETLWNKGKEATQAVEDFTVGNDRILDMRLAAYDVQGSMAHIKMLESIGLLTADELERLTAGLEQILSEINAGNFRLEDSVEDIHWTYTPRSNCCLRAGSVKSERRYIQDARAMTRCW